MRIAIFKLNNFVNARVSENIHFRIPSIKIPSLTEAIKSLDTSKATGLDYLSPRILKISAEVVAQSLSKLINQSIKESTFPSILKVAKLFPIHKSGPKHDPSSLHSSVVRASAVWCGGRGFEPWLGRTYMCLPY